MLAVGAAGILAGLAIDMSGRAPRTAGSNRILPIVFVANVPPRGEFCQAASLPADAARAVITIGTYGKPVPRGRLLFKTASGATSAEGALPAGAHEGALTIPIRRLRGAPAPGVVCLQAVGGSRLALAGEAGPPGPGGAEVNGEPQGGVVSIAYERAGSESWWSLLPTLVERFGRGKAASFGDWTLPACALLLVGVWLATLRLLARELP